MKKIEYLSPTRISLFYKNPTEFYLTYLSDNAPPRIPQTAPMAVGSAFDAFVKSFLHEKLFGKGHDTTYELKTLFEVQVEAQHRDQAWKAGMHVFAEYKHSGALADLMLELQSSITTPRFEIEIKGIVNGSREGVTKTINSDNVSDQIDDIVFLGKPDACFVNKQGANVILDWKVNGYLSKYNTSPMQGYVRLRDNGINKGSHKNAQVMPFKGMMINVANGLEDFNSDWATQLSIYSWLLGMEVGSDFIIAIDQIVCNPTKTVPTIRVAEHRSKVKSSFQEDVMNRARHIWSVVNSDHIFRDMTKEDSQARCAILDQVSEGLKGESDNDKWFAGITR